MSKARNLGIPAHLVKLSETGMSVPTTVWRETTGKATFDFSSLPHRAKSWKRYNFDYSAYDTVHLVRYSESPTDICLRWTSGPREFADDATSYKRFHTICLKFMSDADLANLESIFLRIQL